jgi:5-methylcytosine-specific restriction endonuclease McrA
VKRSQPKRGKPLERRTPLQAKTPLKRGSEIASLAKWLVSSKALGRKPMKRRFSDTGPDRETRELVLARDEHRCVRCGLREGLQLHHRRPRQRGGDSSVEANLPSNLLTVCLYCHDWLETARRARAYDEGLLVRRGFDPAGTPVLTTRGWLLLAADGSFEVVSGPEGEETR